MAVERRSKVLFAETKSVTATQRRFRTIFAVRWTPARNTIRRSSKSFKRRLVWRNRGFRALHSLNKEDQLMSMGRLDSKCKEYFDWIRKCVWCINFLITKERNFSSQPGQKEKIKFVSTHGFRWGLFLFWRDCEQTEHAVLGDGTSWERPWREQKQNEGRRLGCLSSQGLIGTIFF